MNLTGIIDSDIIDRAVSETADPNGPKQGESFDPNTFLKIFMAQLQNQSPFDTVDAAEITQQQAILSQVEQSARQTSFLEELKNSNETNFALLNQSLTEIKSLLENQ